MSTKICPEKVRRHGLILTEQYEKKERVSRSFLPDREQGFEVSYHYSLYPLASNLLASQDTPQISLQ
jgi:hypothetical protein